MPSRPATRGRPRSPAGPSSARGGMPTARTPTRRRSSSCRPTRRSARDPIAIVPLMHRHEVEPADELTHTKMRHGGDRRELTPGPADRDRGLLRRLLPRRLRDDPGGARPTCRPSPTSLADVPRRAVSDRHRWDVVDLRRLRCGDPTADALAAAFGAREMAEGWTLNVEREDVCPVVTLPGRRRHGRLPRRRSARRSATRSGARSAAPRRSARSASRTRPTRWPTSRRSSTSTRRSGAPTASSRTRRVAPRAGSCSGACSSSTARTGRCA